MAQMPAMGQRMPMPAAPAPEAAPVARRLPLAIAYTPVQSFCRVMEDGPGLCKGTIFEELYLPLEEGGLPRGK